MFENIMKLFKKNNKRETLNPSSRDTAKERLHLVLMQDRANVSADFLDLMRQEIIEVIKKYIDIDESAMDVRLKNQTNEDGTQGAPALYANIPILNIKDETRVEKYENESLNINQKDVEQNKNIVIDNNENKNEKSFENIANDDKNNNEKDEDNSQSEIIENENSSEDLNKKDDDINKDSENISSENLSSEDIEKLEDEKIAEAIKIVEEENKIENSEDTEEVQSEN